MPERPNRQCYALVASNRHEQPKKVEGFFSLGNHLAFWHADNSSSNGVSAFFLQSASVLLVVCQLEPLLSAVVLIGYSV